MKFIKLAAATEKIAALYNNSSASIYLSTVGHLTYTDVITGVYQRSVAPSSKPILSPHNFEFIVSVNNARPTHLSREPSSDILGVDYKAYAVRVPDALTSGVVQGAYLKPQPYTVLRSGTAELRPRGTDPTWPIGNFATYLASAPDVSTLLPHDDNGSYSHTSAWFRLSRGASYSLSGSLYISNEVDCDVIDSATLGYKISEEGSDTHSTHTIHAHVLKDGTAGGNIVFNEIIDLVKLGYSEAAHVSLYLRSYTTSTSPVTGDLGDIVRSKTCVTISDMNKYPDTKTFGPFALYDQTKNAMYNVLIMLAPIISPT